LDSVSQDEIVLGLLAVQGIGTYEQSILTEDEPNFTLRCLVLQLPTASHYLYHYSSWFLMLLDGCFPWSSFGVFFVFY